jgi:large subunit ribosomal protein L20
MVRVKRALMSKKRHKSMLKATKGFRMLNSRVFRRAKNAWMKAGLNAYIGRKQKKRNFRALWNARINAAARLTGTTYSKLIHGLYQKKVILNRKVLSNLAISAPEVFKNVVNFTKN